MAKLQQIWTTALKTLVYSWRAVLLTHLAFIGLSVALFAPLVGLTGRLLLKLSGQTALADQDIAYFLLSPAGVLALIVFTALFIAILAFEQAVIMCIALAARHEKRISPFDALLYAATRAHKLWLFTARLVIRILILCLPLLAVAAMVAWYLITDYDINFYLTEKPPEFQLAALLIGAILTLLLLILTRKLMQWSIALPLVLFADVSPADSFHRSTELIHGQRKQVLAILLSWAAASLLPGVVILGALKMLGHWLVPIASESLSMMVIMLGALAALWLITNILVTTFSSGTFGFLLIEIYERHVPTPASALKRMREQQQRGTSSRLMPKTLTTSILLATVIATAAGLWLINGIPTNNEVLIVAHRGAAGKAPENTLAAFQQAIDDQTDWIELDVQESADGEIMVMHDSDFMKLAGDPIKIWDASQDQIKQIDIGSWYDPQFSAERAPTLEQVLTMVRGKAKVVIELKYYGHDIKLEQAVIDVVEKTQMVNDTAIMSLKYKAVEKIRQLRPGWIVGLLSATAIGDLSRLDTDFLAVAMGMASPGFIDRAHRAGRQVFVWTVNDPVSMSRMISLGVDGIITDEPEMARRVLTERAGMSTMERLLIHATQLFGEPYVPAEYRDNSP